MLLCFSKICLWHRLLVSTKFVSSSNTIRGDRKKRVKMWKLSLYHHQRCCPRLNPFFGREKKTFLTLCSWKSQIRLFWKIVFCRRRRRCCCLWQSQRHSTISFLLNLSLSLSLFLPLFRLLLLLLLRQSVPFPGKCRSKIEFFLSSLKFCRKKMNSEDGSGWQNWQLAHFQPET